MLHWKIANATGTTSAILCCVYSVGGHAGRTDVILHREISQMGLTTKLAEQYMPDRREPHAAAGQKLRGVARSAQLSARSGKPDRNRSWSHHQHGLHPRSPHKLFRNNSKSLKRQCFQGFSCCNVPCCLVRFRCQAESCSWVRKSSGTNQRNPEVLRLRL